MKISPGLKRYARIRLREYPCRHQCKSVFNENGEVLIIILGVMILLMIFIPALVYYVQQEAKWTEKQKRSNVAFHLAEAGIDRGYWKLLETADNFDDVLKGISIPPYDGTTTFTDLPGGEYKIWITSTTQPNTVKILSLGRDASKNEIRAIEALYSKEEIETSLQSGGEIEFEDKFWVHWGPVVSYNEIDLEDQENIYYPKKISKYEIDPWDNNVALPNYYPPSANEENYAGKAFDTSLTEPPALDFNYYREKAKQTKLTIYENSWYAGGAGSPWKGTGYLDKASGEIHFDKYQIDNSTGVIFIEHANCKIDDSQTQRTFMRLEALIIAKGNFHYHAWGRNPYTVNVPPEAWRQYLAGTVKGGIFNSNATEVRTQSGPKDSTAANEYPADNGLNTVSSTWTLPHDYDATALGRPKPDCGVPFHGFLYTYEFNCNGGKNIIVGSIKVATNIDVDTLIIYYDKDVAKQAKLTTSGVKRKSWKEVKLPW